MTIFMWELSLVNDEFDEENEKGNKEPKGEDIMKGNRKLMEMCHLDKYIDDLTIDGQNRKIGESKANLDKTILFLT